MRKAEMIKIVKGQKELWLPEELWDDDPLGPKARPTTKILKHIIVDFGFSRLTDDVDAANQEIGDVSKELERK